MGFDAAEGNEQKVAGDSGRLGIERRGGYARTRVSCKLMLLS
ncbi:hypothetical protein PSMK_p00030 (plasmid) [Phycisphaera mikurensis NBRC 102666]|uniref:Uncharacterized protein n=1 Tax=Phycisphaera mikurensis (strain NBRC 102666 / KCTC 22515 / FYK2301M01) TaxID=1142394 RepID=I0IJC7_PHYMF|nr:hypothetical protein PSMK_p00030 [Phycisphaera mikurensis NBRC 102666]